jgi:pseudolysin
MEFIMRRPHRKLIASGVTALTVSLASITSTWAATSINLQHQPLSALQTFTQSIGGVASQIGLQQISSDLDFNKTAHVRFQQTYAGYPIWASDGVIHVRNGEKISGAHALQNILANAATNSISMNGVVYQDLANDLSNAPAYLFNAPQAEKALQNAVAHYQKTTGNKNTITETKTNLMVFVDNDNKAHWTFLVSFLSAPEKGLPAKPIYLMDALTFAVYQQWDNIQTYTDAKKGGGFGGNVKMGKLSYDSLDGDLSKLAILRDAITKTCFLQNADVTVKNRKENDAVLKFSCKKVDPDHNKIYWNADQDQVNGGYSPGNDALYAGKVIKEMYQKWFGIPVLTKNGQPMMLNMRVHEYMDNAYWDGSQMTFGDGISYFYPLVSLGVGAHEVSHGFTQQHSNLAYYGRSGGLNESFSDMAAQAAEFYSVGHNSWQIGPEIFKAPDKALRYMDDPRKDGRSIDNANDYHDGIDVHYSSGVFNKFFYLLGTSKGWNTKKAFAVMVQANTHYWTSNTNFDMAACGVLKGATDYKYDVASVSAAATKVGIDTTKC